MLYWRVSRQRLINMKNKQAIFKTLLLIVVLLCPGYSFAQTANESSGESVPVDIKANEQQFLDKEIVAKGTAILHTVANRLHIDTETTASLQLLPIHFNSSEANKQYNVSQNAHF